MDNKTKLLNTAGVLTKVEYSIDIPLPEAIYKMFNAFKKHGKKLYIVGGAVRDALMGKTPKDFDIATESHPDEVAKMLKDEGIYTYPSGENFAIISAVINNENYEIATFRKEDYSGGDGRRPTWVGYSDMQNDVMRRDFTINALYYDIERKKVIDLVGGIEDLKNKRIKPVGSAYDRFTEDRLRVLRALRFSHRFGSPLDKDTINAMRHYKDLPGVSNERIREELIKGLESSIKPELYLKEFLSLGFGHRVFGNVNLDTHLMPGLRTYILVFAKLLWNNPENKVIDSLGKLKCSKDEIKSVIFLHKLKQKFSDFDKLVFDPAIDSEWFMQFIKLRDIVFNMKPQIINKSIVMEWARISNINTHVIDKFSNYILKFSAKDFPQFEKQTLGKKIAYANTDEFLHNL